MLGFFSRRRRQEELPLEIYVSLVDWLYDGAFTLLAGGAGASIAMLLTAWKTQYWPLWFFAAATALLTVLRVIDMYAYARSHAVRTRETMERWELRYAVLAGIQHALLGLWCFFDIAFTTDVTTHMVCS